MIVFNQGCGGSVVWLLLFSFFLSDPNLRAQQLTPREFVVELTAEVRKEPAQIVLKWRGDQYARGYTINRRARTENEWNKIGNAAGHETWFTDSDVSLGKAYEYQVVKEGTLEYTGYGYIYAGIELPLVENRGRIILLVESSIAAPLATELKRLEADLMGEGWRVVRHDVSRAAKVTEVKEVIRSIYNQDPTDTRALFLFGNIPVPYSGNITPDEHDNHLGAWPADVYYADIDGVWTDSTVTSTGAEKSWNHNIPGDGKFDQSEPPSAVELQVGRVDLSRMTCFANKIPSRSEVDLLRLYLEKDHAFRHGRLPTAARALVYDGIGLSKPEPLSSMAWRNFAPFVGENIERVAFAQFPAKMSQGSYLWSAAVDGGSYTGSGAIGSSDIFATETVNIVFAMSCGSYFGDWDNESNFLRAALGSSGRLLASIFSAQPQWICHTMALGEPIGAAAKITQENDDNGIYVPHNRGAGQVHVALHGDPTIRAHPLASPSHLRAVPRDGGVQLSWDPSTDGNIASYYIYEADGSNRFRRIAETPANSTTHFVAQGNTSRTYMVRAVALTVSPSGSYWNASQGAIYPDLMAMPTAVPAAPQSLVLGDLREGSVQLRWINPSADAWSFEIERRNPGASAFVKIGSAPKGSVEFIDATPPSSGIVTYRVRAVNPAGASDYSNLALASLNPATVEFAGDDRLTQGRWMGKYGSSGVALPQVTNSLPPYTSLTFSNAPVQIYGYGDVRGPQVPGSSLFSQNSWQHVWPWALNLSFPDDQVHQVAFYFMSYWRSDPKFEIQITDLVTRNVLDRRVYDDVNEGVYVIYNLRGNIHLRIFPENWWQHVELYGVFVDDVRVQPVRIDPPGGPFAGNVLVTMSTPTPGAEIRYTSDHSEPTTSSPPYTAPLSIYSNTRLRARAFRAGYPPSAITEALFTNGIESSFALIGSEEATSGNWVGKFGSEGYMVARGSAEPPAYAQVRGLPEPWLWKGATDDARAPFRDKTGSSRVAAGWYGDEISFELNIMDSRRRAVALYFLDWDRSGRKQQLEVLDASGAVRESHTVENFANGKYFVLGIKGHCKLRLKKIAGPNAVLSAIMFDPAPVQVNVGAPVPFGNLRVANGTFSFAAQGLPDQRFCLDGSVDLLTWTHLTTNTFSAESLQLQLPLNVPEPHKFLRGHFVP